MASAFGASGITASVISHLRGTPEGAALIDTLMKQGKRNADQFATVDFAGVKFGTVYWGSAEALQRGMQSFGKMLLRMQYSPFR
jgi:hypothetical protein